MVLRRSGSSSDFASSTERARRSVHAVILAGGAGTRLWPLARAERPKPFLTLGGHGSLFRSTFKRAESIAGRGNVMVVAGVTHLSWIRKEVPDLPPRLIITEETGRNTAASVALAATWIGANRGDGIMVVLPADHHIGPLTKFRGTVRLALRAVMRLDGLVTIGLPPRGVRTGFGYLRPSEPPIMPGVRRVARFVEKPHARAAARMVRSGRYLWNSGMFVWRAGALLEELQRHCPEVFLAAREWERRAGRGVWNVPGRIMKKFPDLPIDRAVLERSSRVLTVRAGFNWSDLGTWDAVADLLLDGRRQNTGIGDVLAVDSSGCVAFNEEGHTAFVGVRDVVAVRSGRTVLVCRRGSADRVREIASRLSSGRGLARGRMS